jgi:hypothetical protein
MFGRGLDRLSSGTPRDVTRTQKRDHVGRKQHRRDTLRVASRVGVFEMSGVGRGKIDQLAVNGGTDAPQRTGGCSDLERRELHEPYIL